MTSWRRVFLLLGTAAAVLSAWPGGSEAFLEASEADASAVERTSARVRAAIAAAEKLAETHLAARAELEQLRSAFQRSTERLALLASEFAEKGAMRDWARRCIVAQREVAVAVALEQMRRDRLNASTRSPFSMSAGGASPISLLRTQRKCSSIGSREETSPSLGEIAALSRSVDELRSQLERSEPLVERTRSELEEAIFRVEEEERRRVAALSRLKRGKRSAELADGAEAVRLPPTRASLRSPSDDATGAEPRFRLPLRGAIVQRFGERRGGRRSQGLGLSADRPQPVLAPGTGVVAYAGPFRDIGLLLIIEHRNAYHSLVIGASRLDVQAGDVVTEGQAVGWLDRGPSGGRDLYLELRRVGEPVDPMPVLSAHEGEVEG